MAKAQAGADGEEEEVGVRAEHPEENVDPVNPTDQKAAPIVAVRRISIPARFLRLPGECWKNAVFLLTSFAIIPSFEKISGESLSRGSEAAESAGKCADRKGSHPTGLDEDKLRSVLFLIAGGKEV